MVVVRGGEGREWGLEFHSYTSGFYKMKRGLGMGGGDGHTTVRRHLMPPNCTLKMTKMVNITLCIHYDNTKTKKKEIVIKVLVDSMK